MVMKAGKQTGDVERENEMQNRSWKHGIAMRLLGGLLSLVPFGCGGVDSAMDAEGADLDPEMVEEKDGITGISGGLVGGGVIAAGEWPNWITWPVGTQDGIVSTQKDVISTFGPRIKTTAGAQEFHTGIDIGTYDRSFPVRAVAAGIVKTAAKLSKENNYYVSIQHEFVTLLGEKRKLYSYYMHLRDDPQALLNTKVDAGAVLGVTAQSGVFHLHFEIRDIPDSNRLPGSEWERYAVQPFQALQHDFRADGVATTLSVANQKSVQVDVTTARPDLNTVCVHVYPKTGARLLQPMYKGCLNLGAYNLAFNNDALDAMISKAPTLPDGTSTGVTAKISGLSSRDRTYTWTVNFTQLKWPATTGKVVALIYKTGSTMAITTRTWTP